VHGLILGRSTNQKKEGKKTRRRSLTLWTMGFVRKGHDRGALSAPGHHHTGHQTIEAKKSDSDDLRASLSISKKKICDGHHRRGKRKGEKKNPLCDGQAATGKKSATIPMKKGEGLRNATIIATRDGKKAKKKEGPDPPPPSHTSRRKRKKERKERKGATWNVQGGIGKGGKGRYSTVIKERE